MAHRFLWGGAAIAAVLAGSAIGVNMWLDQVTHVGSAFQALRADAAAKAKSTQTASQTHTTTTVSKSSSATPSSNVLPSSPSGGLVTVTGPLVHGAALLPVELSTPGSSRKVRVLAEIDTGAQVSVARSHLLRQAGALKLGKAAMTGIGGSVTTHLYGPIDLWVVPSSHVQISGSRNASEWLAHTSLYGGLQKSRIHLAKGVQVIIGQDALAHSTFVLSHGRWTLTFTNLQSASPVNSTYQPTPTAIRVGSPTFLPKGLAKRLGHH